MSVFLHRVGLLKPAAALPTRVYLDRGEDESNLSTYTFSSFPLGTADATRKIVVGIVGSNGSSARTISAVTIAGVSASVVIYDNEGGREAAIAIADVPTGTSGDIVVQWEGTNDRCVIWAWAAYNLSSSTPVDTGNSVADPLDLSLNTSAGGLGFACAFSTNNTTTEWVGFTEDDDGVFGSQTFSAASLENTSAATPLTVTATDQGGGADQEVGVSASFL